MNNIILSVRNLCKSYNSLDGEVEAVSNFSLDIYRGEFLSIIGPSGCGKSTILNILAGLENDYSGSINFAHGVSSSYMTQDDGLFPWLSVYDNAVLGLKVRKKLTKESSLYVKNLLCKYGLKDFINTKVSNLSGGQKQRVALIRTIATKPDLIFLDEPFSALDYQSRLKVSDDIYNIIKSEGITVIMVSHDVGETVSMSDRALVLTNRPTRIKNIYDIKLTDKSTPIHNRTAKEFTHYYELLWRDIDGDK